MERILEMEAGYPQFCFSNSSYYVMCNSICFQLSHSGFYPSSWISAGRNNFSTWRHFCNDDYASGERTKISGESCRRRKPAQWCIFTHYISLCPGSSYYRWIPFSSGYNQFRSGCYNGNIDRTSGWPDILQFSSLATYNNEHWNCFNADNSLLHVLCCRALSFFRRPGSGKRRPLFIKQTTEYAHLSEQVSGNKCMDDFRLCA